MEYSSPHPSKSKEINYPLFFPVNVQTLDARDIEKVLGLFKREREFQYIQIGISSRCFLSCAICPSTCFQDRWNSMDMSTETCKNISRFFPYTKNVYLSGWGEPLLNSHFLDMIRMAKAADCSVGFTTNGSLLNDALNRKIIDLQTDLISVSLGGATAETHEYHRAGSDFEQLTRNMRSLDDIKKSSLSDKPQVQLLFMMTKENMEELPLSIEFAAKVGAHGVVATNLDYVAVPLHNEWKAFSCHKADEAFVEHISEAEERARDKGVSFHAFPIEMKLVPVCSEDPLNSLYISEDGYVSPCVYLTSPTPEIPRIFCGENSVIPRTSFGNINEQSLFEIWNSHEYVLFRNKYKRRHKRARCEFIDDLPEICKTCYKAYGI